MKRVIKFHKKLTWFYWGAILLEAAFIVWHLYQGTSYIMPFFHFGFLVYFNEQRKKGNRKHLAFMKEMEMLEKQRKELQKLIDK